MAIEDFEDLRVFNNGFDIAMRVFEISKVWPPEEKYSLTDQVRRSSRSVCSNIAEAWFKRRYPKHFVSKLSDATQEAAETIVWLKFARECGYLDEDIAVDLDQSCRSVIGGVVKMMERPDQWCGPSILREDEAEYGSDHQV